jgi:hypothetical protein
MKELTVAQFIVCPLSAARCMTTRCIVRNITERDELAHCKKGEATKMMGPFPHPFIPEHDPIINGNKHFQMKETCNATNEGRKEETFICHLNVAAIIVQKSRKEIHGGA